MREKMPFWLLAALGGGAALALLLGSPAQPRFMWPLRGRISSGFGPRKHPVTGGSDNHEGIDIVAAVGTPVLAPAAGTITNLSTGVQGGRQLTIDHGNGWTTGYAHLSSYTVKLGQSVSAGQKVASSGQSGNVTGPHLHFTIRLNRIAQNPLNFLTT